MLQLPTNLSPLNGLRAAQQPQKPILDPRGFASNSTANDPIELYKLQQQQQSDLKDKIIGATGSPNGASPYGVFDRGGLEGLKAAYQGIDDDVNEGPIARQRSEVDASRRADLAAIGQGFTGGTPYQTGPSSFVSGGSQSWTQPGRMPSPSQQMAQAEKEAEAYKVGAGERAASITGGFDVQKQKEAEAGALARQQEVSRGNLEVAKQNPILSLLQGGLNMDQISGISKSGVTLNHAQVPAPVMKTLLDARANATGGLFGPSTQAQAVLDQAVVSALNYIPASPDAKGFVREVLKNPKTRDLRTFDEIIRADPTHFIDPGNTTPEEKQQLENILSILRGTV